MHRNTTRPIYKLTVKILTPSLHSATTITVRWECQRISSSSFCDVWPRKCITV